MRSVLNPAYSGLDLIESADQKRQRDEQKTDWPYTHLFPPPNSSPVNQITQGLPPAIPAIGSSAVALAYRVPSGSRFFLTGIVQNAFGGLINPGDILWTVDNNRPVGIADFQGMGVQGLISVPVPLGSFPFGVIWEFARPYEFEPLDLIQSKALNVSAGSVGAGTFLVSAFIGFRVPVVGLR